jgi:hypothetical protein
MDPICKLQPNRTMHLQVFDDYGAAAALWGASDTGFTVSSVFRDSASSSRCKERLASNPTRRSLCI